MRARTTSTRAIQHDHVAQTRIVREWNVPHDGDADTALLDLAAFALGGGKTSRLYQRLVYKDKLVDSVSVDVQAFALASQFVLTADIKNGVDQAKVEAAIDEIFDVALSLGGTLSGEHGIGYKRKSLMQKFTDPVELDMMRRIKKALDPNLILNPGKIFDVE